MDNYAKIISVTPSYLEYCDEGSQGMFSFSKVATHNPPENSLTFP